MNIFVVVGNLIEKRDEIYIYEAYNVLGGKHILKTEQVHNKGDFTRMWLPPPDMSFMKSRVTKQDTGINWKRDGF